MAKKPAPTETPAKPVSTFGKLYQLVRERWPEYVIEVVVIIFSITISFAFDEWKDDRHKQEQEQTYLKGLYSDIQTDTSQLKEVMTETKQVIEKATYLSRLDPKSPAADYNQFVTSLRFVFKRPRFISEDATFADLKSTGNMQVISSFPLKKSIFDYYKQYEAIVQVETAELETTNTVIAPNLLRDIRLAGSSNLASTANWPTVVSSAEFQNSMLIRQATRQELLDDYQQLLKLGNKILASIKPKLK
ncbi:hypothetical protein GCM10028805_21660 [Spirosoma harenae]